jgi:hypothetical protein
LALSPAGSAEMLNTYRDDHYAIEAIGINTVNVLEGFEDA